MAAYRPSTDYYPCNPCPNNPTQRTSEALVQIGLPLYNPAFVYWIASHLPAIVGCGSVLYACYKFLRFLLATGRVAAIVEQRVLKAEDTLHLLATNHLVHIQSAVEETNKHLSQMNHNLELVLVRRGDEFK